ncbi:MAG: hypothetical protein DLM57_03375 [Pseudonocardiales bacterium]|nr:MAG: hypothetical protein DLM57_03375 [Pseudonocardiales bacterium]
MSGARSQDAHAWQLTRPGDRVGGDEMSAELGTVDYLDPLSLGRLLAGSEVVVRQVAASHCTGLTLEGDGQARSAMQHTSGT